ncbi:MAG TPA: NPCBM/NEW2 domain-containing protein, partial [Candidatus Binatia bacterium]|nr:NPCBM/NEW2 domain-containing protein [Candidatus Binatia bacterium]
HYYERLTAILEDIQSFYRDGMKRCGFGPETFPLERDAQGKIIIHLVNGKEPESHYHKPDGGKVAGECRPVLEAAGISMDRDTVLIFCNLATWNPMNKTFSHHSPYYGLWDQTSGLCFAVDSVILNLDDITNKEPMLNDDEYGKMSLGKFNTIFIGGIAHELGHAFALPHCGERQDEKVLGTSIMGVGNHTYRDELRGAGKGSFLAMGSAMHLAGRPLFNGSDKGMTEEGRLETCDLILTTNVTRNDLAGKPGALRLEGTVLGSPPVYGVIAYFDSRRDGGYHAPTATAVPDSLGRFAIEISNLESCENGELRVEFCHANGAVSERHLNFSVNADGRVDISQWRMRHALEPVAEAIGDGRNTDAATALQTLEQSKASDLTKNIALKLVGTLDDSPKPKPAAVSMTISKFALGDTQPESAKVGWLKPAANRVPLDPGVRSPLLDCGHLYATGLYAHAPSEYVFDLGGKWKELRGEAGLHTLQQPYGSVIFIIKTDGKEVFRSDVIHGAKKAKYQIDVT